MTLLAKLFVGTASLFLSMTGYAIDTRHLCHLPQANLEQYYTVACLIDGASIVSVGDETSRVYGVINAKGEEIVTPQYFYIYPFIEGLARVYDGEKFGLINSKGDFILPVKYKSIIDPDGGRHYYLQDGYWLISEESPDGQSIKTGMMDSQGNIVIEPKYKLIYGWKTAGYLDVSIETEEGLKFGLVDYNDNIIVPIDYDNPINFNDGLAEVCKNRQCNFINEQGDFLLPYWVDELSQFSDSRGLIKRENKFGFVDKQGQLVVPMVYASAESFEQQRAIVARSTQTNTDDNQLRYGVIDVDNQIIIDFAYDNIARADDNLFIAWQEDKVLFFDNNGQLLWGNEADQSHYQDIIYASIFDELMAVKQNEHWGFIDHKLQPVIALDYHLAFEFSEGLAAVKKGKKIGFIDANGNIVIPFEYDDSGIDPSAWQNRHYQQYRFKDGSAIVRKNNKWGIINKDNSIRVPFNYDKIRRVGENLVVTWQPQRVVFLDNNGNNLITDSADNYFEAVNYDSVNSEYTAVKKNGKWGYINMWNLKRDNQEDYHTNIPFIYESAFSFSQGLAAVKLNGKFGFIDEEGNTVIAFKYDDAGIDNEDSDAWFDGQYHFNESYSNSANTNIPTAVRKNNRWGVIDREGNTVVAFEFDNIKVVRDVAIYAYKNGQQYVYDFKGQLMQ